MVHVLWIDNIIKDCMSLYVPVSGTMAGYNEILLSHVRILHMYFGTAPGINFISWIMTCLSSDPLCHIVSIVTI